MAMRDETRMLLESMGRLFEDKCTKQVVDAAEKGSFPDELWRAVSETGVPLAALPESAGGADAEWSDLYAVLRVAGRYAAPIPLAETMLAGWIAAAAGLELTDQPMTVGPVRAGDRAQQRRLASAVGPDNCQPLAFAQAQVDAAYRDQQAVAGLDLLELAQVHLRPPR